MKNVHPTTGTLYYLLPGAYYLPVNFKMKKKETQHKDHKHFLH